MRKRILGAAKWMFSVASVAFVLSVGGVNAKAAITQTKVGNDSAIITWDDKSKTGYYLGYSNLEDTAKATEAAKSMALSKAKYLRYAKRYTFEKLTPGARYVVAIAFKDNNGNFTTTTTEVKTLPQTVSGLGQEKWYRETTSCRVRWNRQPFVSGYDYKFMDANGSVLEQGTTQDTTFLAKASNKSIYTASVRTYSYINGVRYDSPWCTPAYLMAQPARKKTEFVNFDLDARVSGGKMKISWEKVKGLDGYTVYATTRKNGAFQRVATVGPGKGSCTISKIDNKKVKKNKTYYIYVQAYKKSGGRTYTSGLNYITAVKGKKHSPLWVGIDWK